MSIEDAPSRKTIAEIADEFDLTLRALRFYEDRSLLAPTRVGTARFYTPKDERRLKLIQHGKRLGFTLAEIETVLKRSYGTIDTMDFLSLLGHEDIEQQIRHLKQQRKNTLEAIADLHRFVENRSQKD